MMKLMRQAVMQLAPAIALIAGLAGSIQAQVYEWSDAEGRHFSDSLEAIPKDSRSEARLLIPASSPAPEPAAPAPTPKVAESEEEGTRTFATGWDRGFEAGWAAGFQAAIEQQPECTAEPEVIVLQSAPVTLPVPRYDTIGGYYLSPYTGTVTVPFDGGRSRGLTRREQMQRLQGR